MQVALEALALVVLRGDQPLARRGQLVELLGELRGQAHVGDGCRGLAGDRPQQGRARPRCSRPGAAGPSSMRPSVSSPRTRSQDATGSPVDVAGRPRRAPRRARLRRHQRADPHPRRVEPVAHGLGQPREQLARVTACSSCAPSSLSIVSCRSRSPKTARRIRRCSQLRTGRSTTARSVVSRTAGDESSAVARAAAPGVATRARVDDRDEQVRRARDAAPRSPGAMSNAP